MIKYTIAVSRTADKDGDFKLVFEVHSQDASQIPFLGAGNYTFDASNGWQVISAKAADINIEDKKVLIMGALGSNAMQSILGQGGQSNVDIIFDTNREKLLAARDEINAAIAEWVAAGGFEKEEFDTETVEL